MILYWVLHNGTFTDKLPFVCICDIQPTPFDFVTDYNTPISKTMLTGTVEVDEIEGAYRIPFGDVTTDLITYQQVDEMVMAFQSMGGSGVPTVETLGRMFGVSFGWVVDEVITPLIDRYENMFASEVV